MHNHTHTQNCNTGGDKYVVTLGANTRENDSQKYVKLQMSAGIMWTSTVNYVV
jgi:hypothetical protein